MLTTEGDITTIKCDKCGRTSKAPSDNYNDWFFKEKWALNKGRKYIHLCYGCLSPKFKKAMDFTHNYKTN